MQSSSQPTLAADGATEESSIEELMLAVLFCRMCFVFLVFTSGLSKDEGRKQEWASNKAQGPANKKNRKEWRSWKQRQKWTEWPFWFRLIQLTVQWSKSENKGTLNVYKSKGAETRQRCEEKLTRNSNKQKPTKRRKPRTLKSESWTL